MMELVGRLARGLGAAARFTQLDWVRRQLVDLAGIEPYPGTLNLALEDEENLARWTAWQALPGQAMEPADAAFCRSRCYPVRIEGRIPGAVLLPDVAGYPPGKVEVVAALPLCRHLALAEGARVRLELARPLAVEAVLFDLDGTLVDSTSAYLEVARCAARQHGVEVTEAHVRDCLASGTSFWRGVIDGEHPEAQALRKELSARAAREWPRVLREHGRLFSGLRDTLDSLQSLGLRLGIVSGARAQVLELLREAGLLARFEAVVLGADVKGRKPDPEGILQCLRRLGVAPAAAAYVGDTPLDIQASRAAGVAAVAVLSGAADAALLSAHAPDRLVASVARLPGLIERQARYT